MLSSILSSNLMSSNLMSSNMMSSTMFMIGGTSALGSIALIFYLLLHEIVFTGKLDEDLKTVQKYIKTDLKKGLDLAQIKEKLLDSGCSKEIISKAYSSIKLEQKIQALREKDYSFRKIKQMALKWCWPEETIDFIIKKQRQEMKHVFAPAIVALTLVFLSVVVIKIIEVLA